MTSRMFIKMLQSQSMRILLKTSHRPLVRKSKTRNNRSNRSYLIGKKFKLKMTLVKYSLRLLKIH